MRAEHLLGLLGAEVPPQGVGRPIPPSDGSDAPPPTASCACCPERGRCQRADIDPDLVEELMELKLDRLLLED